MKKIFTILAAAATVAALASCAKETWSENGNAVEIASGMKVFRTVLEKTALNDLQPEWVEGDEVKILWKEIVPDQTGNDSVAVKSVKAAVDPVSGEIVAEVGEALDYYYAVYPASATSTIVVGEYIDSLSVKFASTVDGSWGNAHYAAAACAAGGDEFNFLNIGNTVKFEVKSADVTSVKIYSAGGENVGGSENIEFNDVDINGIMNTAASTVVTVNVEGPGVYYAPVSANTEWLGGFRIVELNDSEVLRFSEGKNPVVMERNVMVSLGDIEENKYTPRDWFFKTEGSGNEDGTDWDNAAGPEKFKELLYSTSGYLFIEGVNLHVAAGNYDMVVTDPSTGKNNYLELTFPSAVNFSVLGGYPADAAGKDLTRDSETNKTVFTTTANCSNARMFYCWNNCAFGNVVFDGLTFQGTALKKTRGWVMYINDSCKFPNEDSRVTFSNCLFDGVECDSADNSYYGLIDLNNINGRVSVTNCEFKNNVSDNSTGAAALYVEEAKEFAVSNCNFTLNSSTSTSTYGGLVLIKGGNATIDHCSFSSNTSAGLGGAIGVGLEVDLTKVNYTLPNVVVSDCSFTGNKGAKGGAIAQTNGELLVQNCTFTDNQATYASANYGGGVFNNDVGVGSKLGSRIKGVGNATFINCTMTGNSSYGRGGAIAHAAKGYLKIYGGSISGSFNGAKSNGGGAIFFGNSIAAGQGPLYLDGVAFSGNYCGQNAANGSGAAIMAKNGGELYINNCSFTGHSTLSKGSGVIHTTNTNAFLGMYNCSFKDNPTSTSVINVATFPTVIANCSFAENAAHSNGIIFSTGTSSTTALANIVLGADASAKCFGNAGKIVSGYNVYGNLTGVTLSPISGASDYSGKTISDIFGVNPAFNGDGKLVPTASISEIGKQVTGAEVKNTIKGVSQDFYDWLVERKAFDGRPADTEAWTSGSYQQ